MTTEIKKAPEELTPPQREAVHPAHDIWLSASAGSGKTQVLSARVIRLLLERDVYPENLLCLTFTKAAAAEMSERINRRLANWVQVKDGELAIELMALGADYSPEGKARARKLFAKVLDAPGGGLQIMTIHSFCQSVLAAFPEEAGLVPGFEPVEGRAQDELLRDTLADLVHAADTEGQGWIIANIQRLSIDMGEAAAFAFLKKCALRVDALQIVPDDSGAEAFARRLVGLHFEGSVDAELARRCSDEVVDRRLIEQLLAHNRGWGTKTGIERADKIAIWLALDPEARAAMLDDLHCCWATKKGTPVQQFDKKDPAFPQLALAATEWTRGLLEMRTLAAYADRLSAALLAGKAFALRYQAVKHARGLVDFDDMISRAAHLLSRSGMADWVRYKLDRRIDHILVDEAQDTNAAQWEIVRAIASDFHAGAAAKGTTRRTIFAVGDYKQAIYGFQGTDPEKYREAGQRFDRDIKASGGALRSITLAQSFRSTPPILDFVNAVIAVTGPKALGIDDDIDDHFSVRGHVGSVELMQPVYPHGAADGEADGDEATGEEDWMSEEKLILADRIARHVRALIDEKPILATTGKVLVPGDIMILLSKRTQLASLLVSRLHAAGVPVAGIDRLRINEPIAVQDLISAIRFALQPQDDLSLACLLVSPLIGWSQEKLLEHGYREKGLGLWRHLRAQPVIADDIEPLREMLATADLMTPYAFVEHILSGPTQGRAKFRARLGSETLVPIEELLNQTLRFQQEGGTSLQGFLDWFVKGGEIIKREGLAASSDVRVMTVHGAKGLQAPVVILADSTVDPVKSGDRSAGPDFVMADDIRLPLLPIRTAERIGQLEEVWERAATAEHREHARLAYVAMTRAAERLIITGSLGRQSKGEVPETSWYPKFAEALEQLGCHWVEDERWGRKLSYKVGAVQTAGVGSEKQALAKPELPRWLRTKAPAEAAPPRPLAPSSLDDDDYGEAPAPRALRNAAQRGSLLHRLFQLYDGRSGAEFTKAALRWLGRQDPEGTFDHASLAAEVIAVVEPPEWADLFGAQSRAEVPLAALVGETVISGRVDRLLIEANRVRVIDFKTGRTVPDKAEQVAVQILRQMAHYSAALQSIFPDKMVEAALLYTAGPKLLPLPQALLDGYKPLSSAPK